jgi:hypothetical protein
VVAIKYVLLLLRADNNGEGGTLSLTALATRGVGRRKALVFLLGVAGASMFLGDSVITPAISVLSAVEGLKLVTPTFEHSVVPLTVGILIGLFAAQSRGTARVASFFAPVMVIWFAAIALAGLLHIHDNPGMLAAINPSYALTGRIVCSSGWPNPRAMPPIFFKFRPGVWSRSAPRSRFSRMQPNNEGSNFFRRIPRTNRISAADSNRMMHTSRLLSGRIGTAHYHPAVERL